MIKEVVIVGSGKFAFSCARISKDNCKNVKVFEYVANENISVLEGLCTKKKIEYHRLANDSLYNYLKETDKKILLVSAFNTYIFDKRFFELDNLMMINYHPALLPFHPGRNSEAWSIYEQDEKTGITWHLVRERVDSGEILLQKEIELDISYTSLKLMIEQNEKGIEAYQEICPLLLNEKIIAYRQDDVKARYHKAKDVPNGGYLDIGWDQKKKYAFLRAMDYGKLKLLGQPKMMEMGKEYMWDSYEYVVEKSNFKAEKNDFYVSPNIVLKNRKEVEK